MPTDITNKVLTLPKKDKIKLYYTLQDDLDFEDDYLAEGDLTPSQWKELNKRIKEIENGTAKLIPWKDVKNTKIQGTYV
jgi:hypothetical protein